MLELYSTEERYAETAKKDSSYRVLSLSAEIHGATREDTLGGDTLRDRERTLSYHYTSETASTAASLSNPSIGPITHLTTTSDLSSQQLSGSSLPKLFVGGLSHDTNDASLAKYFEQFGALKDAMVLRDNFTMNSRGFGFVTFIDAVVAKQVVAFGLKREHVVDGKKVDVKFAVPKALSFHQTTPTLNRVVEEQQKQQLVYEYSGEYLQEAEKQKSNSGQTLSSPGATFHTASIHNTPNFFFANKVKQESPLKYPEEQDLWTQNKTEKRPGAISLNTPLTKTYSKEYANILRAKSFTNDLLSGRRQQQQQQHFVMPLTPLSSVGCQSGEYEGRNFQDLRRQNSAPLMLNMNNFSSNYNTELENLLVPNKIFVGGLLYATGHESLRKFFEQFGPVQSAEVIYNRDTKKSRGFGFVIYKTFNSVEAVLERQRVDRLLIDGKQVEVKLCKAREDAVAELLTQQQQQQQNLSPGRTHSVFSHSPTNNNSSPLPMSMTSTSPMVAERVPKRSMHFQETGLKAELFDIAETFSDLDIKKYEEFEGPQSPLAKLNKCSAVFEPEQEKDNHEILYCNTNNKYKNEVKLSPVTNFDYDSQSRHSFGSIGDCLTKQVGLKTRSWSEHNSNVTNNLGHLFLNNTSPHSSKSVLTTKTLEARRNTFCQAQTKTSRLSSDLDLLASILEES